MDLFIQQRILPRDDGSRIFAPCHFEWDVPLCGSVSWEWHFQSVSSFEESCLSRQAHTIVFGRTLENEFLEVDLSKGRAPNS